MDQIFLTTSLSAMCLSVAQVDTPVFRMQLRAHLVRKIPWLMDIRRSITDSIVGIAPKMLTS